MSNDNVVHLYPMTDVAGGLRALADAYEQGHYEDSDCTIVIGADILQLGQSVNEERAVKDAIFNLTFGVHKLMYLTVEENV